MRLHSGDKEVTFTRFVDEVCKRCGGNGELMYGSTSTWRGGIGGAAMTSDVCDHCWGSGDSAHPWTDLRKLQSDETERAHFLAQRLLEQAMGARIGILQEAQNKIAETLEVLAKKRTSSRETAALASLLARTLRDMATAGRDYVK